MKKLLNSLLIINGAILTVAGAGFVLMYLWQAVITQASEADRSLIFWYLPILMTGLALFSGGLFLFIKGIKKLKGQSHLLR